MWSILLLPRSAVRTTASNAHIPQQCRQSLPQHPYGLSRQECNCKSHQRKQQQSRQHNKCCTETRGTALSRHTSWKVSGGSTRVWWHPMLVILVLLCIPTGCSGVSESAIQFMLYERLKRFVQRQKKQRDPEALANIAGIPFVVGVHMCSE